MQDWGKKFSLTKAQNVLNLPYTKVNKTVNINYFTTYCFLFFITCSIHNISVA